VRAPTRIGVDRAWIVIGCVLAVVALGLAKPWEHPAGPSVAVAQAPPTVGTSASATPSADVAEAADSTATPEPRPTAPPAARPSPTHGGFYLELAASELSGLAGTSQTGWLVDMSHPDPVPVRFAFDLPRTAAMGSNCSGGLMLHEGTNALALALPSVNGAPSAHLSLWRLFDKGAPVRVPLSVEMAGQTGIVLVKGSERGWDFGDYALTIEQEGQEMSFVFCIGRSFRMVDYSLLTLVPAGVDSRAARNRLIQR
jgi:hypothetical protein